MKLFQVNTTINYFEDNSSLTPILKIVHSKLMIYATICNTKETPKEKKEKDIISYDSSLLFNTSKDSSKQRQFKYSFIYTSGN